MTYSTFLGLTLKYAYFNPLFRFVLKKKYFLEVKVIKKLISGPNVSDSARDWEINSKDSFIYPED